MELKKTNAAHPGHQLAFSSFPKSRKRPVPRPFSFPWGEGSIVEEVSFVGRHHEPCIQLLEFSHGLELVRFCSYTLEGRFERNSWLAGREELDGLAKELGQSSRLKAVLSLLLSQANP